MKRVDRGKERNKEGRRYKDERKYKKKENIEGVLTTSIICDVIGSHTQGACALNISFLLISNLGSSAFHYKRVLI